MFNATLENEAVTEVHS